MILEIPKNAETILHILEKAGYEAYVVGGCVRDSILGRSPDDWDITTSAKPEQVKALFHRTVDTGLQHGTVTVLMEKEGYEVTTYRVDGEYEDGRHPKEVTFTASLEEDLKRRDFTINAMAYNPSSGLVDLFGGLEDIERKIIRCVGNPLERFTEDALRIMRAVRFSAQLGFTIEEETRKALKVLAPNLKHVSAERIQVELVKLLMSPHPDYLRVAYEAGITAEFLPEFHRTVDTGLQHGTVTVLMEKEGYEVTTYRVDGEYEDGRHPKEVTFTASLEEDLKRRDFTINAMAYNPSSGLVDLFGGLEDIERKIIRCVGNPLERFTEDALRIMRAVRFSAQLGFTIEEETRKALKVLAPNLKHVSAERIQVELVKLLMSPHPDYLRVAYEAGITAEFLPEFDACMTTFQNTPHHCYTVGEHILHSLCHVRADKVLRITMLLHDIGKPVVRKTDENGRDHFKMHGIAGEKMAAQILRRLKFDNDTIRKVTRLVKWHDDRPDGTTKAVRRAVNRIGEDLFPYYLEVQQADMLAQSDYRRAEKQERLDKVKEAYETIINEHQCVSLKTLAVTGKDLIEAGYKPGREIGETLNRLLEVVLVDPQKNQKEILLGLLDEK